MAESERDWTNEIFIVEAWERLLPMLHQINGTTTKTETRLVEFPEEETKKENSFVIRSDCFQHFIRPYEPEYEFNLISFQFQWRDDRLGRHRRNDDEDE